MGLCLSALGESPKDLGFPSSEANPRTLHDTKIIATDGEVTMTAKCGVTGEENPRAACQRH